MVTIANTNNMNSDGFYLWYYCPRKYSGAAALTLLLTASAMGQVGCDMPWIPPPEEIGLECGQTISYAPLIPSHTPVKTLKIAFHCFQNDDGSGNFRTDNPEHVDYLQGAVNVINQMLADLGPLNIGSTPYIEDSRVQVQLVAIYEHQNTSVLGLPNALQQFQTYVTQDASGYGLTIADKNEVEHILLPGTNVPGNCCAGRASGFGVQGWILAAGWYGHYLQKWSIIL